jgi:nucleoside-diphosphate-sugar epimerase
VHVDDAARFVLAALSEPKRSLLLAGDDQPTPVVEVVHFVCALFGLALPTTSEGEHIPLSLCVSRSIENSETKTRFGVRLAYPTYREGYQTIRAQRWPPS